MSSHECRQGCQCKKQVIPVIFVPDLLGTRLYNTSEKAVVWDPLAGMGSYHTPLGTAIEDLSGKVSKTTAAITSSPMVKKLIELQTVLKGLQGALNDLYKLSSRVLKSVGLDDVAKRIDAASQDANADSKSAVAKVKAQLADIKKKIAHIEKEINNAFEKMGQVEEVLRIARNVWGMISVLEWMFRDASERRKLLVGAKIGRDDTILCIPQDAEKGSETYDKTYYLGQTAIRPSDSADRHLRGWGEVCWEQYGEFLMTLQRHLDAHFNLRDVAQAGATTEMGSIPKPSLVTGKALKDLFAAIEKLFDFTPSAPAAAPATPATTPSTGTEANKAAEPAKKEEPLPWGANPNFAKQMAGYAFPLHVVCYNWMQGSADGAQRLKRRIKQIAGSYQPGSDDETWMTKEPVKQVIVITHGMGGQVMRALLAEVGPETDGSNASDEDNQQPEGNADDYMSGIDDQKSPDAAKKAKEEETPQFSIKPEPNPFGKDLELLKAIHVGVPQTGMPEIYAWFRAGMQTPVKSDSMSDMAVAYVTNQVLGANAAEITAVLSYSQCGLEALPNNDYPKGWLCWQAMPFNLVEGEKPPKNDPLKITNEIYKEYMSPDHWFKLINLELLSFQYIPGKVALKSLQNYMDKTSEFHSVLKEKGLEKSICFVGKNSKPSTRDKIVWQAQSTSTPHGDAETWVPFSGIISSDNLIMKGVNYLFDTNLMSRLADSGEGSLYLTNNDATPQILPVEFILQKGAGEGDGQVPEVSVTTGVSITSSEHHSDIYQDENIRKSVYKEIQQAAWDFNEQTKNKKGA